MGSPGSLPYRPDIDGLRALAVTLVVAYHVGIPGLPGGFVGVDVFFVISGYLITGLLVRELENTGRIDILDFYARRVRRLLPALSMVLLTTLALGAVLLKPIGEQQELGRSTMAAAGFVSNLYFAKHQLDYFAEPAKLLPLLHTWSLAVEEQFYIVWPPALMLLSLAVSRSGARFRRLALWMLGAGIVVSLALFVAASGPRPSLAFHLSPMRGWELGAGAVMALTSGVTPSGRASEMLGWAGIAAIAAAALIFDSLTDGYGLGAILAVGGTCAIIAGGAHGTGTLTSLLSAKAPVFVGRVSYGWYLWHWPLLALARTVDLGHEVMWRDLLLTTAAFGLAVVTWKWIEDPVRSRRIGVFANKRGALAGGIGLLLAAVAVGAGLSTYAASVAGNSDAATVIAVKASPIRLERACNGAEVGFAAPPPAERCRIGAPEGNRAVLLWGDSHARDLTATLHDAGLATGVAVYPRVRSGCAPTVSEAGWLSANWRVRSCGTFNGRVLQELNTLKVRHGIAGVIIAARWSREGLDAKTARLVRRLREEGLKVVVVAESPAFDASVPDCVYRRGAGACGLARRRADEALVAVQRLPLPADSVAIWNLAADLCGAVTCEPQRGGRFIYRDSHHLTPEGAALLTGARDVLRWATRPNAPCGSANTSLSAPSTDPNNTPVLVCVDGGRVRELE